MSETLDTNALLEYLSSQEDVLAALLNGVGFRNLVAHSCVRSRMARTDLSFYEHL
ncbi:MAG: hypothetical protein PVH17_10395 [Anaerolineae bacterium]|jgi:hypothetical protein